MKTGLIERAMKHLRIVTTMVAALVIYGVLSFLTMPRQEFDRAEKAEPYRDLELYPSCKGNLVRVHEELVLAGVSLRAWRGDAARYLTARSRRTVPDLMRDVFGLSISVGAVVGCQKIASRALAAPVDDAKAFVVEAPIKHADETGWREARRRAWLWTVVTATVTVFMIHTRRNAVAARAIR